MHIIKSYRFIFLLLLAVPACAQPFTDAEIARWKQQAANVTIIRDRWGVPHIYGKSDADAVFGMLYVQCENDFPRVERNYIVAEGRLAEAEGETYLYNDLRMRLLQDSTKAIQQYFASPPWLTKLCVAFADGVNYYLYTHPDVKPKLLKRFQPWMPFLFSEGSIGGDIENISVNEVRAFYGKEKGKVKEEINDDGIESNPRGSNGFAIAPSKTSGGHALLMINPHTTFYFRSELHMVSEEGLNAYGASTWGQFFIYQGFNEHCGWMHTSSRADVFDEYLETVIDKNGKKFYLYGGLQREMIEEPVTLKVKGGSIRNFTVYRTHHGPIIGDRDGKWVAAKMMYEPVKALSQSYLRTKAAGLEDFRKVMEYYTNSSNNTVYADDKGNIAYWHGDFMPKRDQRFNWLKPVDGNDASTEWQGLHKLDEIVQVVNPASGWIQNCNSTPFTVSGPSSPNPKSYPAYMAPDDENPRGIHAVRVLKDEKAFTIDKLIAAAYDSYLPAFETLIPPLVKAYDNQSLQSDTLKVKYKEPMQMLRQWNFRFAASSVPTALAIYWAEQLRNDVLSRVPPGTTHLGLLDFLATQTTDQEKMKALAETTARLQRDFGTWKQTWGELNRFQRITNSIEPAFDDNKPSVAVGFTSAFWGSLAAYSSKRYPNTKKLYGNVGNSFVAAVEFGPKVKAKSIVTGGSSSDPASPHFNDQGPMYAKGEFKDVLFYREDIQKKAEQTYHPGDK